MWCDYCQRPVAGEKTTHRTRNTAAGLSVLATGGLSLLGAKSEGYHCPVCGQPVRRMRRGDVPSSSGSMAIRASDLGDLDNEEPGLDDEQGFGYLTADGGQARAVLTEVDPENARAIDVYREYCGDFEEAGQTISDLPRSLGVFTVADAEELRGAFQRAGAVVAITTLVEPTRPRDGHGESPNGSKDIVERLRQLAELHGSGALTDDEFGELKQRLITER